MLNDGEIASIINQKISELQVSGDDDTKEVLKSGKAVS
jgi:hypothetical protein